MPKAGSGWASHSGRWPNSTLELSPHSSELLESNWTARCEPWNTGGTLNPESERVHMILGESLREPASCWMRWRSTRKRLRSARTRAAVYLGLAATYWKAGEIDTGCCRLYSGPGTGPSGSRGERNHGGSPGSQGDYAAARKYAEVALAGNPDLGLRPPGNGQNPSLGRPAGSGHSGAEGGGQIRRNRLVLLPPPQGL